MLSMIPALICSIDFFFCETQKPQRQRCQLLPADMECVLTTLSLSKAGGGAQTLKPAEQARAKSILERAIAAERGGRAPQPEELTEEHPDGCK